MDTPNNDNAYTEQDRSDDMIRLGTELEGFPGGEAVDDAFRGFLKNLSEDLKNATVADQFAAFGASDTGVAVLKGYGLDAKVPELITMLNTDRRKDGVAQDAAAQPQPSGGPSSDATANPLDPAAQASADLKAAKDGAKSSDPSAQADAEVKAGRDGVLPSDAAQADSAKDRNPKGEAEQAARAEPMDNDAEKQAFAQGRAAGAAEMAARAGGSGGSSGGGGSDMGPIAGTIAGLAQAPGNVLSGLFRAVGELGRQGVDLTAHTLRAAAPVVGGVAKFGAEKAGEAVERHQVRSFANKNESVNEQLKALEKAAMNFAEMAPSATQADKMHAFGQLGEARDKLLNGMQSELNAGMTQVKNKNMSQSDLTELADERKERVAAIMDKALDSNGAKSDPFTQGKLKEVKETTLDRMRDMIEKITNMIKNLFKPKGAAPKAP